MKTDQTIALPIDPEVAEEISRSSETDRENIALLLSVWFKNHKQERVEQFFTAVEQIASRAKERGLTEQELEQILAHR